MECSLQSSGIKGIQSFRRTFSSGGSIEARKSLYLSLIRSQLLYCSPLWRPHYIRDMLKLERIQKRATKYILMDFQSDYKTRLGALDLLPLMREFEINDVMFCVRSLKSPASHFNILDYIKFSTNATRSGSYKRI